MDEMLPLLRQKMKEHGSLLIAIDGRCGCGKSSFAHALAAELNGNVFHMDDFYLPFAKRVEGWQTIPAGNMDLLRLREEVLEPLAAGKEVRYRAYNCPDDTFLETRRIPFKPLSIVEGSYSQHPALRDYYDVTLFVTASRETQSARLKKREGDHFHAFEKIWIPMEENYFRSFSVAEKADEIINTDETQGAVR